ncbi:MAG: MoaD/ThiS family protein [Bryobacterales bacterium]|nr:MoaD/ThiS family protein [Bryobacterales bacterium]
MARVYIPALLRGFSGGREVIEIAGTTVREVIENLERDCPGIRDRLLESGRLRSNISVAVDGEVSPEGLREPVAPESEVHFIPAIRGGSA